LFELIFSFDFSLYQQLLDLEEHPLTDILQDPIRLHVTFSLIHSPSGAVLGDDGPSCNFRLIIVISCQKIVII